MGLQTELATQERDQPVIELHGNHAACLVGEQLRESTRTGADFDDRVVTGQRSRGNNTGAVSGIYEEILAQALLRMDAELLIPSLWGGTLMISPNDRQRKPNRISSAARDY
jgi:hypothetical protein